MQVIITLAGLGSRFSEKGFDEPKPAVIVAGKPAIYFLIQSFPKNWNLIFVIGEHFRQSNIESLILEFCATAKIIYCPFSERGPIDTVLFTLNSDGVNENQPVLVSYCDFAFKFEANDFLTQVAESDAAVITYQGFHPTYFGPNSYCHLRVENGSNQVVQIQEKKLFTDKIENEITSVGLYYFKSVDFLKLCLEEQNKQDLKYNKEFYVSLAIQAMMNLKSDLIVRNYQIDYMIQLGTPADTERFEFWYQLLVLKKSNFVFKYIETCKRPTELNLSQYENEKKYWLAIFSYFRIF